MASACLQVGDRGVADPDSKSRLDLSHAFDAEFVSAFSEIFNNIVLHSYAGGSDDEIVIEMEPSAERLVVRITDNGAPFDPDTAQEPDLDGLPEGGMGIFIARAFLDTARYEAGPPNHWTLEKGYASGDAASKRSARSLSTDDGVDPSSGAADS